ncbi:hypothetical protein [Culicoidibacter larvae]|uniref:hypothetical protein n=1 Tax=Culicoidibacter larvae TaxID=2579976 RepID=UPI001484EBA5|nr:hypothetical protein [Culicoidibacter larvae]
MKNKRNELFEQIKVTLFIFIIYLIVIVILVGCSIILKNAIHDFYLDKVQIVTTGLRII